MDNGPVLNSNWLNHYDSIFLLRHALCNFHSSMHVRCPTDYFLLVTFVKDKFVSNVVKCAFFDTFENPMFVFYSNHSRNFDEWPHLRTDDLSTGF